MNFRQLRYFVRTVEMGNITRAAESLNVAQPALGLQIRQLEQELGVPLLVRHSRGITTTRPGLVLYDRACEILRRIEEARNEIVGYSESEKESVILGITPGITNVIGSAIFVDAPEALPHVHLSMVEEMSHVLVDAIERDEIDLAIAYEVPEHPVLMRTPLLNEELIFVCAPQSLPMKGISEADEIDMQQVLDHQLVLAGEKDAVRRLVSEAAERLALPVRIAFEASSVSMMKSLVIKGEAASVMPRGSVAAELDSGQMKGLRIRNPTVSRTLYLVRSTRRAPFQDEAGIADFLYDLADSFAAELGPLVHKF